MANIQIVTGKLASAFSNIGIVCGINLDVVMSNVKGCVSIFCSAKEMNIFKEVPGVHLLPVTRMDIFDVVLFFVPSMWLHLKEQSQFTSPYKGTQSFISKGGECVFYCFFFCQ